MPAVVDIPWRRVRPFLPGAINRLAVPTATTSNAVAGGWANRASARANYAARCTVCCPRRAAGGRFYSTSSSAAAQPVVSWSTLAKEEEDRRRQEIDQHANETMECRDTHGGALKKQPPPSPGAVLIESLTRDPAVPHGERASSLSALVEPAVHYPHPRETSRSQKRHRKSVVRQARLEVIRQAQLRPLPDWRAILRRLVAYTPRDGRDAAGPASLLLSGSSRQSQTTPSRLLQLYSSLPTSPSPSFSQPQSSTWHYDAVSFTFPIGSPAVDELLNGIDDTLWAVRGRTGCVLKLFRWGPGKHGSASASTESPAASTAESVGTAGNSGDDPNERPWLLTLSGTQISIGRAVAEVTRFAKDAMPVVVNIDSRLGDSSIRVAESGVRIIWQSVKPAETSFRPPSLLPSSLPPQIDSDSEPTLYHTWNLVSSSHYLDDRKKHNDPAYFPHAINHGAHEIPRPSDWTRDTFERYVAELTNGRPPPHLAARLYPQERDWPRKDSSSSNTSTTTTKNTITPPTTVATTPMLNSHDRTVIDLLHGLFHEEATRPALSTSAFKMALAFMCQRGEAHRPDARALFVRMEMLGLPMDTETFNIMLASQVKTQDLRNFGATLLLMNGRGHAPDLTTWLLFLRLFESEEVKRHILHAMHARGLLDSASAVRRVAQEMAQHDAERAIVKQGQEPESSIPLFLDDFMAGQADRYGDGWLTRAAANRILDVFGRHGRFADCDQLLGILQQPQLQTNATQALDTVTFNIVLTHCKMQNSLRHAIAVVQRMEGEVRGAGSNNDDGNGSSAAGAPLGPTMAVVAPDRVTYQLLFDMAWQRRLPHVIGVVWHYASVTRQASHWMHKRASRVLAGQGPAQTAQMARVLGGGENGDRSKDASPASPSSTGRDAAAHLGALASARIASRYEGWEPAEPLGQVLQDALDRDNAMLRARYAGDRGERASTPPAPMRIRLRQTRVAEAMAKANDEGEETRNDVAYMEIHVDQMKPKTVRRPENEAGGVATDADP